MWTIGLALAVGVASATPTADPRHLGPPLPPPPVASGVRVQRTVPLPDRVRSVAVSGVGRVAVVPGERNQLLVHADASVARRVRVRVRGDRVELGHVGPMPEAGPGLLFTVVLADLDAVRATDAARVEVGAVSSPALHLVLRGTAEVRLGGVRTEVLTVAAAGGGGVWFDGPCVVGEMASVLTGGARVHGSCRSR